MKKDKTSIVFTGDIGFDRYMDRRWEDDNLLAKPVHGCPKQLNISKAPAYSSRCFLLYKKVYLIAKETFVRSGHTFSCRIYQFMIYLLGYF